MNVSNMMVYTTPIAFAETEIGVYNLKLTRINKADYCIVKKNMVEKNVNNFPKIKEDQDSV